MLPYVTQDLPARWPARLPTERAEERPKNPSEGQRYRDNQQQKGAVFEGAHAPVPLRALNLVIRDMENR